MPDTSLVRHPRRPCHWTLPLSSLRLAGLVAASFALAGCNSIARKWDVPQGRPFTPANFTSAGPLPASIARVAVMPLHSETWTASDLAALDAAIAGELGKFGRFEVIALSRAGLADRFGRGSFLSSGPIPSNLPTRLKADFGADAVLFLDLTHYSPYVPVAIGLRAKLVSVADGAILWAFDEVFDAARPAVAVAAREYYLKQAQPAYPQDDPAGFLQSPARFARYVAFAAFDTLPERENPPK